MQGLGNRNEIERTRKRVGWFMMACFAVLGFWTLSPGIPVLFAPRARASVKAEGLSLFQHRWEPHDARANAGGDGLGPVFNARSCVACHFQGGVGGGGGNKQNVASFETMPTKADPNVREGLIHAFAVENRFIIIILFPLQPGKPLFPAVERETQRSVLVHRRRVGGARSPALSAAHQPHVRSPFYSSSTACTPSSDRPLRMTCPILWARNSLAVVNSASSARRMRLAGSSLPMFQKA